MLAHGKKKWSGPWDMIWFNHLSNYVYSLYMFGSFKHNLIDMILILEYYESLLLLILIIIIIITITIVIIISINPTNNCYY